MWQTKRYVVKNVPKLALYFSSTFDTFATKVANMAKLALRCQKEAKLALYFSANYTIFASKVAKLALSSQKIGY